ncbi:MAG TPA: DUF1501 domain-containing protein [Lacipirellulaceae bacterium]|nr:DUF1501 domain-containing protein [Lacipirellulaceae bacterium]
MDAIATAQALNRRHFLQRSGGGLGALALGSLVGAASANAASSPATAHGYKTGPHFAPKAKRVIYLFQSGAPSQFETFDYKPKLQDLRGQDLPASVRMGQRLTTMTSGQASFPMAPSIFPFRQYGPQGAWISALLPYTAKVVDDLCIVRSMFTEAINHDPAVTFFQTGSQLAGRPSAGAWVAYGLGQLNKDLPAFVVMISRDPTRPADQPLYDRLWGSGFMPTQFQGVKLRSGKDPVLYLANPAGCDRQMRRDMLDDLATLNEGSFASIGDPEIQTRVAQYEQAFRMQSSVPELTDISDEPENILNLYGPEVRKPGTYARNCLLARRLIERDVRFVQLYHMGWDQHGDLPVNIGKQCSATDQPSAALVQDLKQRGLLDDTLVVWGGEFGRTVYSQGALTATNYGRDHHPRCFSIWLAGAGVRPGMVYGATDDFSYNITENPMHVHDLQATMLHLLGLDHTRLTYKFQGRDYRLTDVSGEVVRAILS